MQWGLTSFTSGTNTVPLNISFSNKLYCVYMCAHGTSVDTNTNALSIGDRNLTSFVFREHGYIGAQNGHFWLAFGF